VRRPRKAARSSVAISASIVLERIRAEYIEMPGLSLNVRQAARFFGLSEPALEQLLVLLVESGFLVRDKNGCYRRCH
jgi:hypothetical protein